MAEQDKSKGGAKKNPAAKKAQGKPAEDERPGGPAPAEGETSIKGDNDDEERGLRASREGTEQDEARAKSDGSERPTGDDPADSADSEQADQSGDSSGVRRARPGAESDPANVHDAGPGTGRDPEPEREGSRPPEGIVNPHNRPEDVKEQTEPAEGHDLSSTDHTYAAAGGRTIAGETFDSLVDEDGNKVDADNLFEEGDGSKTYVEAKQAVFEQFYYPNTTEVCSRRLYNKGQRVSRAEAARLKATL